ncbi:putative leader peptide [Streptomyces sp. NPDC060334]|uniref:putative leader peptide n=1 Tax=unclassified Streptomyces TaxID=2593676 RepID=UPI000B064D10
MWSTSWGGWCRLPICLPTRWENQEIREVAVRTPHHARRGSPLTSRRHIDLVRTSSAICQPA